MKKLLLLSLVLMFGVTFVACTKEEVKENVYEEEEEVTEIEIDEVIDDVPREEMDRRIQN